MLKETEKTEQPIYFDKGRTQQKQLENAQVSVVIYDMSHFKADALVLANNLSDVFI